jgi:plastocyanin
MRARMAFGVAAVVGAVAAGQALAQQAVPTVTIQASPTAVSVGTTSPIAAGATRFDITRPAGGPDVDVYVALLVPGFSVDQLAQELSREDKNEGDASLGMVSIQASAVIAGRDTHRALTFTIKPGLTYVVIAEPDSESNGKVKPRAYATFTSGAVADGPTAPAPAATVRMQGLRFKGPSTLPRKGTVRFENRDGVAHFALAFPLRPGTTTKQLGKAVTSSSEAAFGKVVAGQPYMAQSLISGGLTSNDQELTFPKKGRYGLVCFVYGHERLGMYRVVTVK